MKRYQLPLWNTPDFITVMMEYVENGTHLTIHLPEFQWCYTYNAKELNKKEIDRDLETIFSHEEDRSEIVAHFLEYINKERL